MLLPFDFNFQDICKKKLLLHKIFLMHIYLYTITIYLLFLHITAHPKCISNILKNYFFIDYNRLKIF